MAIKMENKNKKVYRNIAEPVTGQPETCDELLHKYGTYEIQPTAESGNKFPTIAQGLPKEENETRTKENRTSQ